LKDLLVKHMKSALAGVAAAGVMVAGIVTLGSSANAANTVTVRSSDFVSTLSDTRANGHVAVSDDGVFVDTESTDSTSKAAEYWTAKMALSKTGTPSFNWVGDGAKPGMQIVLDTNNDGVSDGILVGEEGTYGTGDALNWWVSDAASADVKTAAPSSAGGFGSAHNGTLAQWRTALPNAKVIDFGFSLGSGVKGSGLLKSATLGNKLFDFAGKEIPPATVSGAPKNLQVVSTDTGSATLGWDAVANAKGYRVYRGDLTENVGSSLDNSIKVEGLKPNSKYTFQVAALGEDGTAGPKSDTATGTTKAVNLTVPGHLLCSVTGTTSMHCTSDAVTGANRYSWYAAGTGVSNPSTTLVAHGSSDGPSYDIVGLPTHGSVKVAVAADNDTQGPGVRSSAVSVKLK
jgi:hypothetical protein